jgi:hypothetical protein
VKTSAPVSRRAGSTPSVAPSSSAPITQEGLIAQVEAMGFTRSHILESIAVNGVNPTVVVKWLIENPPKAGSASAESQFYKKPAGPVKVLGTQTSQAEVQKRIEDAKREEEERLRKLNETSKTDVKSEESLTFEDIRKINLEKRAEQEKIRIQERNARMIQLKEQEEIEAKKAAERQAKREEMENSFTDIPAALKHIKRTYGTEALVEVAKAVIQVLTNTLEHPEDSKYRTIRETSKFLLTNFEPHHGSYAILRLLGFVKSDGKYFLEVVNAERLGEELDRFKKVAEITSKIIGEVSFSIVFIRNKPCGCIELDGKQI